MLNRLVDLGNTVIVIEHNLDVIKSADWLIDLGPEGGEPAGRSSPPARPRKLPRWRKLHGEVFAGVVEGIATVLIVKPVALPSMLDQGIASILARLGFDSHQLWFSRH